MLPNEYHERTETDGRKSDYANSVRVQEVSHPSLRFHSICKFLMCIHSRKEMFGRKSLELSLNEDGDLIQRTKWKL